MRISVALFWCDVGGQANGELRDLYTNNSGVFSTLWLNCENYYVPLQPWLWLGEKYQLTFCWQYSCRYWYSRQSIFTRLQRQLKWNVAVVCIITVTVTWRLRHHGRTIVCCVSSSRFLCWQPLWLLSLYIFMYISNITPSLRVAIMLPAVASSLRVVLLQYDFWRRL